MKKIVIILALVLSLYAEISEDDKAVEFNLETLDTTKSYKLSDFKGEIFY